MFDDKLSIKSFEQFSMNLMDGLSKTTENDKLKVFFSTSGGSIIAAYAFYELLDKYKEYIEIIIGHQMTSAGAIMVHLMSDFDLYITDLDLEMMIHNVNAQINTAYPDRNKYEADLKNYNKRLFSVFKKRGLSESKLQELQKGSDVYLTTKEILQIFPNVKVKKYI